MLKAEGLYKRDFFRTPHIYFDLVADDVFCLGSPDAFFVVTVDGGQTRSGPVAKSSLSPFWNYSMDLYGIKFVLD